MFEGLSMVHIAIIAVIALIVLGPEKFPEYAKIASRAYRDYREYVNYIKYEMAHQESWGLSKSIRHDFENDIEKLTKVLSSFADSGAFVVADVLTAYFGVLGMLLNLRMSETISQIQMVLAVFAAAFLFPMVMLLLIFLGLLTPATLKKQRRLAALIITVGAGILTLPDFLSMIVMFVSMILVYELSIWMLCFVTRKRKTEDTDIVPTGK